LLARLTGLAQIQELKVDVLTQFAVGRKDDAVVLAVEVLESNPQDLLLLALVHFGAPILEAWRVVDERVDLPAHDLFDAFLHRRDLDERGVDLFHVLLGGVAHDDGGTLPFQVGDRVDAVLDDREGERSAEQTGEHHEEELPSEDPNHAYDPWHTPLRD